MSSTPSVDLRISVDPYSSSIDSRISVDDYESTNNQVEIDDQNSKTYEIVDDPSASSTLAPMLL